jgi:hypothetical protein
MSHRSARLVTRRGVVVASTLLLLATSAGSAVATTALPEPPEAVDPSSTPAPVPAPVPPGPVDPGAASQPPATESADAGTDPDPGHLTAEVAAAMAAAAAPTQDVRRRRVAAVARARPRHTAPRRTLPHGFGSGVLWIPATLPDVIPAADRLDPAFARRLITTSRRTRADWPLVLALVRVRGHDGAVPASPRLLARLERTVAAAEARARLTDLRDPLAIREPAVAIAASRRMAEQVAALRVMSDPEVAEQAVALALYYRALGRRALVRGLEETRAALARRLLRDRRIQIYDGGRLDIAGGRVDAHVLAAIAYLAEVYGQLTISSLVTGHRLFARPGVISAHAYGRAVDVSAVAGVSIFGHQQPGGVTEDAVRSLLLLPEPLQPRQVISLLGLGGPSFPLADHYDHIHIGY